MSFKLGSLVASAEERGEAAAAMSEASARACLCSGEFMSESQDLRFISFYLSGRHMLPNDEKGQIVLFSGDISHILGRKDTELLYPRPFIVMLSSQSQLLQHLRKLEKKMPADLGDSFQDESCLQDLQSVLEPESCVQSVQSQEVVFPQTVIMRNQSGPVLPISENDITAPTGDSYVAREIEGEGTFEMTLSLPQTLTRSIRTHKLVVKLNL